MIFDIRLRKRDLSAKRVPLVAKVVHKMVIVVIPLSNSTPRKYSKVVSGVNYGVGTRFCRVAYPAGDRLKNIVHDGTIDKLLVR